MSDLSRRTFLGRSGASVLADAFASPSIASHKAIASPKQPMLPASVPPRTNIICFMPDTLRADALGCYGNRIAKTPNFDRLAGSGTLFEECHVAYPICGASRCSMLTGWPTSVRGHRSQMYFLRPDEPNLFRYVKQAGYEVFWAGKNDALAARTFDDSVTSWDIGARVPGNGAARVGSVDGRPTGPLTFLSEGKPGDRRQTADFRNIQAAISILERRETTQPFFFFLPIESPHPPYHSPQGFAGLHSPADVTDLLPANLPHRPSFHERMRSVSGLNTVSADTLRTIRAAYLDKVAYTDWLLEELLGAVDRTGHSADTSIFVLSDHGDYAGDFGLVEKWPSGLERCLTHVPMIARVPGSPAGHRVAEHIELFDFMATSLELAGTQATHTHFARSLMPQILGAPGDRDRGAFSEGGYNTYEPQCFEPAPDEKSWYHERLSLQIAEPQTVSRSAAVRTSEYTFVSRSGDVSELYLRRDDPAERVNRFSDSGVSAVRHQAEQRLLHWYLNTTGIAPMDRDPRDFPVVVPQPHFRAGTANRILDVG